MRSCYIIALVVALSSPRGGAEGLRAQNTNNSPYSSYGFGDLVNSTQVSQAMMAGVSAAVIDPYSVIQVNPASYASLVRPTFECGAVVRYVNYSTATASEDQSAFRMLGLTLGVPFGKGRWGMALGLMPVSDVGYSLSERVPLESGEGDVRFVYEGSGGLNRAFIGVGTSVWQRYDSLGNGHKLALGANFNYLFGGIEQTRKAYYPGGAGYYNTSAFTSLNISSPTGNVGAQYVGTLTRRTREEDDHWRFIVGAFAELASSLEADNTSLVNSFVLGGTGVEFPRDTVAFVDGASGSVRLPLAYGLGYSIFNEKWLVSLEYRRRDWNSLRVDVEGYQLPEELGASVSYALGAQFRPGGARAKTFLERTLFRAGVLYQEDYLRVQGQQLGKIGTTFGLSLPLLNSSTRSRFNLGVELGERGTMEGDRIRERYADIYIGFTITPDIREVWFRKRRIQ